MAGDGGGEQGQLQREADDLVCWRAPWYDKGKPLASAGGIGVEHVVFVYGTLLRGESNHGLLRKSRLIARQARVSGFLYDTGEGYPALVADGTAEPVFGELYAVNDETLTELDALEDFFGPGDPNNLYERVRLETATDVGCVEAWTYTYRPEQAAHQRHIPLGDWRVDRRLLGSGGSAERWLYFAYGSCMDDRRFLAQGAAPWFQDEAGRGVLEGYRLRFACKLPDGGRADLVEEGGVAEGKLYRIGKEALQYLWRREGVEAGIYRPAFVWVGTPDGQEVEALTFFVREKSEETAPPSIYIEEILRGAKPVVSEAYYEELQRAAARWSGEERGGG